MEYLKVSFHEQRRALISGNECGKIYLGSNWNLGLHSLTLVPPWIFSFRKIKVTWVVNQTGVESQSSIIAYKVATKKRISRTRIHSDGSRD